MVTADNLNLDVLELIFLYLYGNDLSSVALVKKSFFAAVIPRLYRKIIFRLSHAKRYPQVMSPFQAILAHPALSTHVRCVEIRTIPNLNSKPQHHPVFLSECTRALKLCYNLRSFRCTVNALPPLLVTLEGKERLSELRVHANITTTQAKKLAEIHNLTDLCLDHGSWSIIDLLPRWTPKFSNTLTSLCLYNASVLDESLLDQVLQQLPGLLGLHVIECGQIDHVAVLRLVSHTPLLERLSLSTTESSFPLAQPAPSLAHLKHLALDTRYSMMSSSAPQVLFSILNHIQYSAPSLISFVMRLPDLKITVGKELIEQLVTLQGSTLQSIAFVDCGVSQDSVLTIVTSCPNLQHFELPVSLKEGVFAFGNAIAKTTNLQTLIDTEIHSSHGHGPNVGLTQENARFFMKRVPSLRRIISGNRAWNWESKAPSGLVELSLERLPAYSSGTYWFMPRDVTGFSMN